MAEGPLLLNARTCMFLLRTSNTLVGAYDHIIKQRLFCSLLSIHAAATTAISCCVNCIQNVFAFVGGPGSYFGHAHCFVQC